MQFRQAIMVATLALGLTSGTAKAAYLIQFSQDGANVLETGSGTIDLAGLTFYGSADGGIGVNPSVAYTTVGSVTNSDIYKGVSGPSSFGSGGYMASSSGTGLSFGIDAGDPFFGFPVLFTPSGYVSGTDDGISTAVYTGTTLAGLGLTDGTYVYTFGSGADADSLTVLVSAVPLPASAPMFGAALMALGAVGYGLKRKSKAAAPA